MERLLLAAARCVTRLRSDGSVSADADRGVQVSGPHCVLTFGDLGDAVNHALLELAAEDCEAGELGAQVMSQAGVAALLRLQKVLARLDREGMLEHAVLVEGEPLLRLGPVGRGATVLPVGSDQPVALSRFAAVRVDGGRLVVSAPGSHLVVELAQGASGLLGSLAQRRTPVQHADAAGLPGAVVADGLRHLAAAGVVTFGAVDPETTSRNQAQWSATDRWMHAVSRGPKTGSGYGGTYRDAQRFGPLTAAAPALGSRTVELAVPDLTAAAAADPSLTEVLEARRSIREHDATAPISVDQLGELLYRTARQSAAFQGSDGQELAQRPYPSGGLAHELEIYPLVSSCAGLDPGLWHYRAAEHRLELVSEPGQATAALVAGARQGAVMDCDPQVTLLLTARFGRVMWKYESVAYALTLKHVGVLYQTIYLVGTAMRLAVCGLGGGDAADFAVASGLDPFEEGTVGELVLGSVPAQLSHPYRLEPITGNVALGSGVL